MLLVILFIYNRVYYGKILVRESYFSFLKGVVKMNRETKQKISFALSIGILILVILIIFL